MDNGQGNTAMDSVRPTLFRVESGYVLAASSSGDCAVGVGTAEEKTDGIQQEGCDLEITDLVKMQGPDTQRQKELEDTKKEVKTLGYQMRQDQDSPLMKPRLNQKNDKKSSN